MMSVASDRAVSPDRGVREMKYYYILDQLKNKHETLHKRMHQKANGERTLEQRKGAL